MSWQVTLIVAAKILGWRWIAFVQGERSMASGDQNGNKNGNGDHLEVLRYNVESDRE